MKLHAAVILLLLATTVPAVARQSPASSPATAGAARSVLFIDSAEAARPAGLLVASGFRRTLADLAPDVAVYWEAPDLIRFTGDAHTQVFKDYLRQRYRNRTIDAIVTSGDPAAEFLLGWDSTPWPDVPVIIGVVDPRTAARARSHPRFTGFVVRLDFGAILDAALTVLPGTKRVVLVSGGDPYDGPMYAAATERKARFEIVQLRNLPFEETRRRLGALPPDSFIVYSGIWVDGAGRPFTPQSALDELAPAANCPIFSYNETFLGHGIVGGAMFDNERAGSEAARLAVRVLSGEAPASIPISELQTTRLVFDGKQLDRWGLSDRRLPPGSQVIFREPTLWQAHRAAVVTASTALLIQAAFIAALLAEVRRRRRIQAELRESSARLITAQEDERSRIARELHDDVSQRLALLALEADMLMSGRDVTAEQRKEQAGRLVERTRTLSSDVHRIAHELHPAILDQLGLVAALRHFAEELTRRQDLRVGIDERDWPEHAPQHVEFAFYRVAQEALQNVVKHSGAREARVTLEATARDFSLCVSDAGRGFDPAAASGARLGFASMEERLRRLEGRLVVESVPGEGTTVRATVARKPSAP